MLNTARGGGVSSAFPTLVSAPLFPNSSKCPLKFPSFPVSQYPSEVQWKRSEYGNKAKVFSPDCYARLFVESLLWAKLRMYGKYSGVDKNSISGLNPIMYLVWSYKPSKGCLGQKCSHACSLVILSIGKLAVDWRALSQLSPQFLHFPISIPPNSHSSQFPFLPIPVPPNYPLNSLSLPVVSGSQGLGQGQCSLCEYGF